MVPTLSPEAYVARVKAVRQVRKVHVPKSTFPCPHNGLFATLYDPTMPHEVFLSTTQHCATCGADVPNREL